MSNFLGIEIGGTKLQLFLGADLVVANNGPARWEIKERLRFSIAKERGANGIRKQIEQVIPDLTARHAIAAIGVGFGGPVNWRTGAICCSHQIEGWSEFPIADWLSRIAAVPVFVDNDANVAALGEAIHGAGQGCDRVFYVTMGSGVGGGMVVDQQIYHGATPGESEIGHLRLDKTNRIVEESCSGWAVDLKIRAAIGKNPESHLAKIVGTARSNEARFLRQALEAGDALAGEILDGTAEDLAFGLSHVVHLFHPEKVVLGGGLSLAGEPLRRAAARHLDRFVMHAFTPRPRVLLAELGEEAVPVGALELAKQGSHGRKF